MAGMTTPMSHTTPGGRGFQGQMTTPGKMDQGFGGNTAAPNAGLTGIQHEVWALKIVLSECFKTATMYMYVMDGTSWQI